MLALHEALTQLARQSARVVECRYFAGYDEESTARALNIIPTDRQPRLRVIGSELRLGRSVRDPRHRHAARIAEREPGLAEPCTRPGQLPALAPEQALANADGFFQQVYRFAGPA